MVLARTHSGAQWGDDDRAPYQQDAGYGGPWGGGGGGGFGGGRMGGGFRGGDVRPGDWTCPSCGANVFASKSNCFRCQTPRPEGAGAAPPQGGDGYGGGGYGGGQDYGGNFGGGGGFGGGGFGGGRGNVRPGDWTCPSCGANVFASKSNCFRCQTPKPVGEAGAGGGFDQQYGGQPQQGYY